jgi:hypothetical protein
MAAPAIQTIFPNDTQTNVPIRADIELTFDVGIDLQKAIDNIAVYGADSDRTSGPDSALWIDGQTGANPYFLSSPGYMGRVPCTISTVYVETDGTLVDPQPEFATRVAEAASGYYHKVVVRPDSALAPETEYNVYIIGDAETGTDTALSAKTVYDVDDSAAVSTTGVVTVYGGYEGIGADTVRIKITTAGDVGTALYKWWYADTEIEADARTGKRTSRRFRRLEDGLQIRFSGSGYLVDDVYDFEVHTPEPMAASYSFSFTTGTGSIQDVPSTASTSVIGTVPSVGDSYLTVLGMTPEDGSWHQAFSDKTITIQFSEDLDDSTVTDETVTVYSYPVSGDFEEGPSTTSYGAYEELFKKLTVSDDTLTIEL